MSSLTNPQPFFFRLLLLISCALVTSVSHGVQVANLYSVSVEVASQSQKDRDLAFDDALETLIIKLSGDFYRVTETNVLDRFGSGKRFVQAFKYRDNPAYEEYQRLQELSAKMLEEFNDEGLVVVDSSLENASLDDDSLDDNLDESGTPTIEKPGARIPAPFLLSVSFSSQQINEVMVKAGIPIWGSVRPSVLLGLVVEEAGERTLMSHSDQQGLEFFADIAEERGLPLFLPTGDLQDLLSLNLEDVWALFPESLDEASVRYQADVVVMMRLYPSGEEGKWSANWRIQHKDIYAIGELYDTSQEDIAKNLITDTAFILTSRYAVLKTSLRDENAAERQLNIEVAGIDSFKSYVELQRYLDSLPPIAGASLKWLSEGRVGYELTLDGTRAQFFEYLDLTRKLVRKDALSQALPYQAASDNQGTSDNHGTSYNKGASDNYGKMQERQSSAWLNASERARLDQALESGEDMQLIFQQLLSKPVTHLVWKGQ